MNPNEEGLQAALAAQPSRFKFLKELMLRRCFERAGENPLSLHLVLVDEPSGNGGKLCLEFDDIRELRLGDTDAIVALVLSVRPIRERGLEGLNYRVTEEENGILSFYCRDARVVVSD